MLYVSTLGAVSALFTVVATQARARPKQDHQRQRLQPPLPKNYEASVVISGLSSHAQRGLHVLVRPGTRTLGSS